MEEEVLLHELEQVVLGAEAVEPVAALLQQGDVLGEMRVAARRAAYPSSRARS